MIRSAAPWLQALLAVAATAWLTSALLPLLGLASSALLFLLPVLFAAVRGGVGPGLFAALAGVTAYNYFLLEPRFTFRVHELDNLISAFVLGAVAVVTSRLATLLMCREAEANERARASAEVAALSSVLGAGPHERALPEGLGFLSERYGEARLLDEAALHSDALQLSSLDRAAARWAIHNGDLTGHGTEVMPASSFTFVPLGPRSRPHDAVLALARPLDGSIRPVVQLEQVRQLCLLLGQSRDRASLEAVRREREVLEGSERLRRAFLASLAHDFRTPLTVITGQLELLAPQAPEAKDALLAAQRLERMMADLVGAARIDAGCLVVANESLDLVDIIGAACDNLELPAGVTLMRSIPPDLPFVIGDPALLHHVLTNLLDNAFRHTRSRVRIAALADRERVLLQLEDNGAGILDADRERIFERFSRAEGSDRTDGSGLGLAIVKGFAEAMTMHVTVSERPGGGARFTLSMPAAGKRIA